MVDVQSGSSTFSDVANGLRVLILRVVCVVSIGFSGLCWCRIAIDFVPHFAIDGRWAYMKIKSLGGATILE